MFDFRQKPAPPTLRIFFYSKTYYRHATHSEIILGGLF